jgi:hypothetical protein
MARDVEDFFRFLFCFVLFFALLELRAYTLSHSTSLFYDGCFQDRFHKLFAWTGFKSVSS